MKLVKLSLIVCGSLGLIFLGACGSNEVNKTEQTEQTEKTENISTTANSATQTPAVTASPTAKKETDHSHDHGVSKGGQVVETGKYHLEFIAAQEADKTHLDFYILTGDNHEIVPDAKVTAQVQLPDGKQLTIPFNYDAQDQHYHGLLNEKVSGQYQLKITADVKGEKATGRFNFNR